MVAFDGDVADKRKKGVRFAFVDLSTAERREAICRREVELNSRFSPDVYLGVEEVVDDDGVVVDHAVRMRRMPAERRLSTLVRSKADAARCVRQIARLMAVAHAEAATSAEIASVATPASLLRLWEQNLEELQPFEPEPLDPGSLEEIGLLAAQYLKGRTKLLEERIQSDCVLDGHGDLLADNIYCLDDGPRVLDCLEFDDRLRWGDVLYDVGFLAMDLERLGRADLAGAFMGWYREFSAEAHPESLEHHYVAYRALVRSKISCLRGSPEDLDEARAYLAQCLRHLRAGQIRLVIVGGLPGTGKTTTAMNLGDEMRWPVLRSDELRKQRAGLDPGVRQAAPYKEGLYSPAVTDATYTTLFDEARLLLENGQSVIIDASFSGATRARRPPRSQSRPRLGSWKCGAPSRPTSPPSISAKGRNRNGRLRRRRRHRSAMRGDFDEWPSATDIDTRLPRAVVAAGLRELVEPRRD